MTIFSFMHLDALRALCLSFPGTREQLQWGDALLFKVGGKMFAVTSLEPSRVWLSFKADPEAFAELCERPAVIPAPYLARAKWVGLESRDAISSAELSVLLRTAYDLIAAKLPRKTRESLTTPAKRKHAFQLAPKTKHALRPKKRRK